MTEQSQVEPNPGEQTTTYALDRTVLANERTFAAWLRTGLAALATGLGVEKFMVQVMPDWGTRSIAMTLVALSGVAFALAGWRYAHLGLKLDKVDVKMVPAAATTLLSIFLVLCSVIALASLWIFEP